MEKKEIEQKINFLLTDTRAAELQENSEFLLVVLDAQQKDLLAEAVKVRYLEDGSYVTSPVKKGEYRPIPPRKPGRGEETVAGPESSRGPLAYARNLALRQILKDPRQVQPVRRCLVCKDRAVELKPDKIPADEGTVCQICMYTGALRTELKLGDRQNHSLREGMLFVLDEATLLALPDYPDQAILAIYLDSQADQKALTPIFWRHSDDRPEGEDEDDLDADDADLDDLDLDDEDETGEENTAESFLPGVELTGCLRYHYKKGGTQEKPDVRVSLERVVLTGEETTRYQGNANQIAREGKDIAKLLPWDVRKKMLTQLKDDQVDTGMNSLDSTYLFPIVYWNQGRDTIKVDGKALRKGEYFLSSAQEHRRPNENHDNRLMRIAYALRLCLFEQEFGEQVELDMARNKQMQN